MPPRISSPWWTAAALGALLLADVGVAHADTSAAKSTARNPAQSARATRSAATAPRLPQTRYTVRKQIESIEPISWLERYGEVRIRERKR